MHADGAVHAVVGDDDDDRQPVFDRRHELHAGHLEAAIAGERNDQAVRVQKLGGNGRRQAVAHRPRCRRQFGPELPVAPEAVNPDGVIAGAVADDRILRQAFAEIAHDPCELDVARRRGRFGKGKIIRMRRLEFVAARLMLWLQPADRRHERRAVRDDAEGRRIDPSNFLRVRIDVNQRLLRLRNVEQAVA